MAKYRIGIRLSWPVQNAATFVLRGVPRDKKEALQLHWETVAAYVTGFVPQLAGKFIFDAVEI